jgi:hypothetical protein
VAFWKALTAASAAVLMLAVPARAAAPNYILVSGPGLSHPVLLADWNENLRLLLAVGDAPPARGAALVGLRRRPRLDLAEFWAWSARPRPASPARASQHSSFYPASGSKPAIVVMTVRGVTGPRVASKQVLRILERHRIPTRDSP